MSKIVTTNPNTKFDPLNNLNSQLNDLGLNSNTAPEKEFSLNTQQERLNPFSNIETSEYENTGRDVSLYSNDTQALDVLNEQRAQNQSASEQLFKGVGRILTTIGTEIGKVPGYVGGAVAAGVSELSDPLTGKETNSMGMIVDNLWVNAFESLDESIKESMPIHLTKDVQEGDILTKLGSSAWWSTTGADGIGFMLSMFAPGQALKALKIGEVLAGGIQAAGQSKSLGKVLTAANILRETEMGTVGATQKLINNLNSGSAVVANTFIESSAEAANTFDNVKKQYLQMNPGATEEEASTIAGNAAANVFKLNMALLAISNSFDEVVLFKGFNQTAEKAASSSVLGRLFNNGVLDIEAAKKIGLKQAGFDIATSLPKAFIKEGLFEEGFQTEIQKHYEDKTLGKTKLSFTEDVIGNYFDDLFSDVEMQEAVVLGGILGGGMSLVTSANKYKTEKDILFGREASSPSFIGRFLNKKEKEAQPGLANIIEKNFINSFRTAHDIAKLDSDNKPIFENGKLVIDENKLKEAIEQKDSLITLNQLHNIAILEGNKIEEEMYADMLSLNYFLPFLQQEGGYEILKEHVSTQVAELMIEKSKALGINISDNQKETTKKKLLEKVEKYNKMYNETKETNVTELHVRKTTENSEAYNSWKNKVFNEKLQALLLNDNSKNRLAELKSKFANFINEDGSIKKLTEEDLDTMDPVDIVKYKIFEANKDQLEKAIKDSRDKYLRLSNKKGLTESFEEYKKGLEEDEKIINEESQNAEQENVDKIVKELTEEEFYNSIRSSGYEVLNNPDVKGSYIKDEQIIIENDKGDRLTLQSRYDYKTKKVDHFTIDKNGNVTKISDADGKLTKQFLSKKYRPVSKQQISLERKALKLKEHRKAQLALIDEIINHKTNEITNSKQELDKIENDLIAFQEQLTKQQEEVDAYYKKHFLGKPTVSKNLKGRMKTKKQLLSKIQETISNLENRKTFLQIRILKLELFIEEYNKFKTEVKDLESFSVKENFNIINKQVLEAIEQLKKDIVLSDDIVEIQNQINESNNLIKEFDSKLEKLYALRDSLIKVIKSHEALFQMLQVSKNNLEKAKQDFNNIFQNVLLPYNINKIVDIISKEPDLVLNGETLVKNNIITNALTAVEYFNNPANEAEKLNVFNTIGQPITEEDIYDLIKNIFSKYQLSEDEIKKEHGYTAEEMFGLAETLLITKKEIADLKSKMDSEKSSVPILELQKKYIMLKELMMDKVNNRFAQIKKEQELSNIDSTQKQVSNAEPEPLPLTTGIRSGKLTPTAYSTTGKNLNNTTKESEVDEQGYPVLNENTFQQTWFKVIDKYAANINDFKLLPVHALYDDGTTDDLQKTINANNPNSRGNKDVFVFLTDKEGKPIKVDNQGNISSSGNYVMTSLRLSDDLFGDDNKIIPDNLISDYLKATGLTDRISYDRHKDKKVGDIIKSKQGREQFKDHLDKPFDYILDESKKHAKQEYEAFIDSIINLKSKDYILDIDYVTKGFSLYRIKNGERVKSKVLDVLPKIILDKGFGTDQLKGAKLGLVINQQIKIGDKFVSLSPGTVYLQTEDGVTLQLDPRKINAEEAKTVMFLLSMAEGNAPLNTINVSFPSKKDGSKYYYFFNGKKMEDVLPVFYRKNKDSQDTFSLLHSLINYGAKGKDKLKKGEIYIQNGQVVYTDFNNQTRSTSLIDLKKAIESDSFDSYNESVKELYNFLLEKRVNVNKTLLGNNPIFMYPRLKKDKSGYYIDFDTNNTYYSFLLNDVLSTTLTTPTDKHPQFLQRNLVFKPQLTKVAKQQSATKTPEVKPVSVPAQPSKPSNKPVNKPTTEGPLLNLYNQTVDQVRTGLTNAKAKYKTFEELQEVVNKSREGNIFNQTEIAYSVFIQTNGGEEIYTKEQIKEIVTQAFDKGSREVLDSMSVEEKPVKKEEVNTTNIQQLKEKFNKFSKNQFTEVIFKDGSKDTLSIGFNSIDESNSILLGSGNLAEITTIKELYNPQTKQRLILYEELTPKVEEKVVYTNSDLETTDTSKIVENWKNGDIIEWTEGTTIKTGKYNKVGNLVTEDKTNLPYSISKITIQSFTNKSLIERNSSEVAENKPKDNAPKSLNKLDMIRKQQANPISKTSRIKPNKPADKVVGTDKLIESLIQKQIIKQNCK